VTVSINDTTAYHRGERASLGWEQTISECLRDTASPYMEALKAKKTYGDVVADLLEDRSVIADGFRVLEVGGGYGTLARSLLTRFPSISMTMVDISPLFLDRQRQALASFGARARFEEVDVLDYLTACDRFDLIISNEGMGDFPAIIDIPREVLIDLVGGSSTSIAADGEEPYLVEARDFVRRLDIDLDDAPEVIHLNTGAARFIELAMEKSDRLFVAEHSSDWTTPDSMAGFFRDTRTDRWPKKIILFGHREVTICFGHVKRLLAKTGCSCVGGSVMELLSVRDDPEIRYILLSGSVQNARHELIGEFIDHVKEYQWLLVHR
jgi:hypothetical protein